MSFWRVGVIAANDQEQWGLTFISVVVLSAMLFHVPSSQRREIGVHFRVCLHQDILSYTLYTQGHQNHCLNINKICIQDSPWISGNWASHFVRILFSWPPTNVLNSGLFPTPYSSVTSFLCCWLKIQSLLSSLLKLHYIGLFIIFCTVWLNIGDWHSSPGWKTI